MKSLKMLMMAAITILTISVFAQSNTTNSTKEQMKMEVMKLYTFMNHYDVASDITGKYVKGGLARNLSPKEQMKTDATNFNEVAQYQYLDYKPAMCPTCITLLNHTPKEQLKMKVMGLYNCPMNADMAANMPGKCSSDFNMN